MEWLSNRVHDQGRLVWNIWHLVSKYGQGLGDSNYRFSVRDALLYWHERNWKLPDLEILEENGTFCQLRIGELMFYWPKSLSYKSLPWLFNEVFHDPQYNPATYAHSFASIPRGGWVIDGGACEGFFGTFALQRGADRVIAVEPLSILCAALEKTFADKQQEHRFAVIAAALGKEISTSALKWSPDQSWNSYLSSGQDKTGGEQVEIVPIDKVVEAQKLQGPGLIKLDVEGSEMDALRGARNTLKTLRPHLAVAVYHQYENGRECAEIIKDAEPSYQMEFRGMYGWFDGPPRPYLLFAW